MSVRQIHGILAAIAFVGLFPIGAILMRVIPGRFTWIVHGVFQTLAYGLYVAAAALGIRLVRLVRIPPDGASMVCERRLPVTCSKRLIAMVANKRCTHSSLLPRPTPTLSSAWSCWESCSSSPCLAGYIISD